LIRNTCINRSFAEQTFWGKTPILFQLRSLISERNKNKAEKVLEFLCMCLCVCAHTTLARVLYVALSPKPNITYVCIIHLSKINLNFHLFLHRQWRWLDTIMHDLPLRENVVRLHVILRKYLDLRKRLCFPAEIFKIIFRHICWQITTWY